MPLLRYFRFRLRTLLVFVTSAALTSGWAAYSLQWIKDRHAFYASAKPLTAWATEFKPDGQRVPAPAGLGLLGAHGVYEVHLVWSGEGERTLVEQLEQKARRLFPEAAIIIARRRQNDVP